MSIEFVSAIMKRTRDSPSFLTKKLPWQLQKSLKVY